MKFSEDKKNSIKMYILEKIQQKTDGLSNHVATELGISKNTVHTYLSELQSDGVISKSKRDSYELVTRSFEYRFKKGDRELEHDTCAYDEYLYPLIKSMPTNIEHIWSYGMSEMVNNVIDHSSAESLYLLIEQNYLSTTVILVDDGVGIFKKIKDYFSLSTLDEAVCELFKGKLTTDSSNHSGEGIFFTSKMMDEFFIVSDGKIFTTSKYDNDSLFDIDKVVKGTCVFMSLSNFTNKKAAEIFDIYSNEDSNFYKTSIPLKNIFDKAPISRSQAKRICNRLDSFKEIIVDFDGVSWMGQGFAHQIFVVYARANPEITLKPINMSDEVKNMYHHVVGNDKSY